MKFYVISTSTTAVAAAIELRTFGFPMEWVNGIEEHDPLVDWYMWRVVPRDDVRASKEPYAGSFRGRNYDREKVALFLSCLKALKLFLDQRCSEVAVIVHGQGLRFLNGKEENKLKLIAACSYALPKSSGVSLSERPTEAFLVTRPCASRIVDSLDFPLRFIECEEELLFCKNQRLVVSEAASIDTHKKEFHLNTD
ncbi:hypothetical protein GpartN1_g1941.t1 [Galdieria partita]|uniref:Uncharacterized protein n=1 Tax=Galdieria partita TaxID=83374 RepID=A0A9C7UP44_9RHOD|nr:hypothetical protein GpartN1_g1926.t1 [Galdieria partita]GJQ10150.1 hypothetical protein GpartN1_g1941.t1 [Galdieria partita]